jgi:hypothetical protein
MDKTSKHLIISGIGFLLVGFGVLGGISPGAYTAGGIVGLFLSKFLGYTLAIGIISLAVSSIMGKRNSLVLPLFAWLFVAAGLFDIGSAVISSTFYSFLRKNRERIFSPVQEARTYEFMGHWTTNEIHFYFSHDLNYTVITPKSGRYDFSYAIDAEDPDRDQYELSVYEQSEDPFPVVLRMIDKDTMYMRTVFSDEVVEQVLTYLGPEQYPVLEDRL